MKGLRKYLTPFAPDQSGAVSMLYAMGGMIVIVDAGGCAGNICGFDEPRWQPEFDLSDDGAHALQGITDGAHAPQGSEDGSGRIDRAGNVISSAAGSRSRVAAVFSAGLRDMDAILGRDEMLVKKLIEASKKIDAKFIALVGTPVPAVIGTDLPAIARMTERKTGLPCVAVSTDGMHLYDRGIEEALLAVMKRFAGKEEVTGEESEQARTEKTETERTETGKTETGKTETGKAKTGKTETERTETGKTETGKAKTGQGKKICGVLGITPLDLFDPEWIKAVRASLEKAGYDTIFLYGMEGGTKAVQSAGEAGKNYVISPAGLSAAKYLSDAFGTAYEVGFPADPMILLEEDCPPELFESGSSDGKKVLVVHQQVLANSIRSALREQGCRSQITAATWFELRRDLMEEGDLHLSEEDDFTDLVLNGKFDVIIADPSMRPMASGWGGTWIDAIHFAVSGQMAIDRRRNAAGTGTGNAGK